MKSPPLPFIFLLLSISAFAQKSLMRLPKKPVCLKYTSFPVKENPSLEAINKKIRVGRDLTISGTTLVVTAPAFWLTGLAFQFGQAHRQERNNALNVGTQALFYLGWANFGAGVPMLSIGAV